MPRRMGTREEEGEGWGFRRRWVSLWVAEADLGGEPATFTARPA